MGSGDRDARRVENAARGIEAATRGDKINEKQIDSVLNASHILENVELTGQLVDKLDRTEAMEGVLPKLAFNFADAKGKEVTNERGDIDKGRLEEFARTTVSPTHKLAAQALLRRWGEIDVDGVPGISNTELKEWAAKHGVTRPLVSDVSVGPSGGRARVGGVDVRTGRDGSGEVNVGGVGVQIDRNGRFKIRKSR